MTAAQRRTAMLDEAVRVAAGLQESGQVQEAASVYLQVLEVDPRHAGALHMLGVAAYQGGQLDEAVALIGQALEIAPGMASAHGNLGAALLALGRREEAIDQFREQARLEPKSALAQYNLGAALAEAGRFEDALGHFEAAAKLAPANSNAWLNLGGALVQLGRSAEALQSLDRAAGLAPSDLAVQNSLGVALKDVGRMAEAQAAFERALALDSGYAPAYGNLGLVFTAAGRYDAAVGAERKAVALDPGNPTHHTNLGNALRLAGQLEEALPELWRAVELGPGVAAAHNNLGVALKDAGDVTEAIAEFRRAAAADPGHPLARSNLLYTLRFDPAGTQEQFLTEATAWAARHAAGEPLPARVRGEGKARIGYVSADLCAHPVSFFLEPVLAAHDRTRFEVFVYNAGSRSDAVTDRLRGLAETWRDVEALDDDQAAELVQQDAIDVLVDLGGHTAASRLGLFARKPAPVQVSWLGFNATTGMNQMDAIVADRYVIPKGDERFYVERPLRLPVGVYCFQPPDLPLQPGPLPAERNGYVTFGCFSSVDRFGPQVLSLWAEVLRAVPGSRLLLKAKAFDAPSVRRRFEAALASFGVAKERFALEGRSPRPDLLARYLDVDVGLDSFPCNGATTTVEGFWMGVPIVSLRGDRYVGRIGESLANVIGHPEWVAATPEEYVERAKSLASDLRALAALRAGLRDEMLQSPIGDAELFTRALENAFMQLLEDKQRRCA